jgi:hypothetical protein
MSDQASPFDLREQLAQIDRAQADTRKLIAESDKFKRKLIAETLKLDKERWWFLWLQLLTVSVSSAVVAAIVARLI